MRKNVLTVRAVNPRSRFPREAGIPASLEILKFSWPRPWATQGTFEARPALSRTLDLRSLSA